MYKPIYLSEFNNYCVVHGTPALIDHITSGFSSSTPQHFDFDYVMPSIFASSTSVRHPPRTGFNVEIFYSTPTTLVWSMETTKNIPHHFFAELESTYGSNIKVGLYSINPHVNEFHYKYGSTDQLHQYFDIHEGAKSLPTVTPKKML